MCRFLIISLTGWFSIARVIIQTRPIALINVEDMIFSKRMCHKKIVSPKLSNFSSLDLNKIDLKT